MIGARIVWAFTVPYLIRALDRRPSQVARRAGAAPRFLAAWSGMRGAVSLAAALALPLETDAGAPFPAREVLIFITFGVIFATLVIQGLTLPLLVRALPVEADDAEESEEIAARIAAAKAALERLEELGGEEWTRDETVERLRGLYQYRKRRFAARAGKVEDDGYEDRSVAYQQLLHELLAAQRLALVRLRNEGVISSEVMRQGRARPGPRGKPAGDLSHRGTRPGARRIPTGLKLAWVRPTATRRRWPPICGGGWSSAVAPRRPREGRAATTSRARWRSWSTSMPRCSRSRGAPGSAS